MSEIDVERPRKGHGFWRGLGMFILWLIRLVFAIGLGTLLGVAIYYVAYEGIPAFYSQVLVPIQVHGVKIDLLQADLQKTQASLDADLRAARGEIRALQELADGQAMIIQSLRSSLEAERANREQRLGLLQADINRVDEATQRQSAALSKLEGSVAGLSSGLTAANDKVEKLNGSVASLQEGSAKTQKQAQAAENDIQRLDENVKALQTNALKISEHLAAIQGEVLSLRGIITMPVSLSDAFERRLVLMQAAEGILKARLHLLEKNAGYAKQALALARDNVAWFAALSADLKPEQLTPLVKRAEAAGALIESDPFVAAQELEIIWYSLEKLISTPVAASTPTAAPTAGQATPTATAAPAQRAPTTPTAVPATPTHTPTPTPTR